MNIDTALLSRVTVVDENGRAYEKWDQFVTLSIQDQGRTLKVFLSPSKSMKKRLDTQVGNEDHST